MPDTTFTQSQREALINILALGMYADNKLSSREDDSLNSTIESIGWDSGVGRTLFVQDAITRATHADDDEKVSAYLRSCAAAFDSSEIRSVALDYVSRFLESDGIVPAEGSFLYHVRKALGL
jgi:hypothetical protein